MKIYTKKGDTGTTSLLGGTRVAKDDLRLEAYGTVDELNANLGLLSDQTAAKRYISLIREVQNKLFTIGSHLANDAKTSKFSLPELKQEDVTLLEKSIDVLNEELPELKNFVIPGGHAANSVAHVCRTVCRRAERRVAGLTHDTELNPLILVYLNRLSDWLFVFARYLSQHTGSREIIWQP
jgi:cob(I)alamin adenosyltransferase